MQIHEVLAGCLLGIVTECNRSGGLFQWRDRSVHLPDRVLISVQQPVPRDLCEPSNSFQTQNETDLIGTLRVWVWLAMQSSSATAPALTKVPAASDPDL